MSELTTNVFGSLSLILVLWHWKQITKSFLDKVDVLLMVLDTRSNDEAFLWGDVVHDELLENSGFKVIEVLDLSKSWHTESVVTVSCSKHHLLGVGEWVVFGKMVGEIVGL